MTGGLFERISNLAIGHKLILTLILVSVPLVLLVGGYATWSASHALEDSYIESMQVESTQAATSLEQFLYDAAHDVEFLGKVPPIQGIIRARAGSGHDSQGKSGYQQWVDRLAHIFNKFGIVKEHYEEFRYLDEQGNEMVRVAFHDNKASVISGEQMQNRSAKAYFRGSMNATAEQVYISDISLSDESTNPDARHIPIIRYGTPIFDDNSGKPRGAIVGSLLVRDIVAELRIANQEASSDLLLVNSSGEYLFHPEPGKMLGPERTQAAHLDDDYPGLLERMDKDNGVIHDIAGQVVVFQTLHPNPDDTSERWIVLNTLPRALMLQPIADFQLGVFILIAFVLAGAVSIGSLISRTWIVNPMTRLLTVFRDFGSGNSSVRINVRGQNEFDQLGRAFNEMANRHEANQARETQQLAKLQQAADIQDQVNLISNCIRGIASGDLSQSVETAGNSEQLQQLSRHLNEMIASLRTLAGKTVKASDAMQSTMDGIRQSVSSQSASANEQAAAVNETTTTLEEIRATSLQTREKVEALGESAAKTRTEGELGLQAVDQAVKGMDIIRDKVEGIAATILALSGQTQQIGDITNSVSSLAQQLKMLALNASIEAAKAGEAGKGFAVVAAEVKDLAEQSQQATEQVSTILQDIQHATDKAVMATEEGTKGVDSGTGLVTQAGAVVSSLTEVIREAGMASQQIVAAVRQEVTGIEQISSAMRDINKATLQFVSTTKETHGATEHLAGITADLRDSTAVFKL